MHLFLLMLLLLCSACPRYEDSYSGTYRQVLDPDDATATPLEVEIFRYGHNLHAIVRFYEGGADPFSRESRCAWTKPTTLAEDMSFTTQVEDRINPIRLGGRLVGDELQARVEQSEGNTPDLVFERINDTPNATCASIQPRTVTAKFGNLSSQNEFDPGEYEIRNPYFGIQWIAVQPIQTDTIVVLTAFTPDLVAYSISGKVTQNKRGLNGQLSVFAEAPDEEYRTVSGDTRFSIAHFVVVDDEADDDSFVSWDRGTEPIIAAGVRGGQRLDAPSFATEHNMFGRAILFVEGSIDDLGPLQDVIEVLDERDEDGNIIDEVDPEAHFYVAEVYAEDERIVGLRLRPSATLQIPVTVTTEFLEETNFPLPRLFPVD